MVVPIEFAWAVPLVAPFIMGLLVGAIVKRTVKLIMLLVALIIVLSAVGYTQLPTIREILTNALKYLPKINEEAGVFINILPYSSATFMIGLAIGLWKA